MSIAFVEWYCSNWALVRSNEKMISSERTQKAQSGKQWRRGEPGVECDERGLALLAISEICGGSIHGQDFCVEGDFSADDGEDRGGFWHFGGRDCEDVLRQDSEVGQLARLQASFFFFGKFRVGRCEGVSDYGLFAGDRLGRPIGMQRRQHDVEIGIHRPV